VDFVTSQVGFGIGEPAEIRLGCQGRVWKKGEKREKDQGEKTTVPQQHGVPPSVTPLPYLSRERRRPVVLRPVLSNGLPLSGYKKYVHVLLQNACLA
jgi:hypothetical protein